MDSITFIHQYTVENYFSFSVAVKSGAFSGSSSFCLSEIMLKDAVTSLNKLYENLSGTYQINDYDSDDYVFFEFLNLGHVLVSGQLGGSYNPQHLCFQFISDQTALLEVIKILYNTLRKTE